MLKGTTTIELTDVNTGEKKVYESTNMVTNALNEIVKPVGYIKSGSKILGYPPSNSTSASDNGFSPFSTVALGGILMFNKKQIEDVNTLFPSPDSSLVACGIYNKQNVSTTNKCRGSYNSAESSADGRISRKFVYDFDTTQGNGEINSVCLTHQAGGACSWASENNIGNITCLAGPVSVSGSAHQEAGFQNFSVWNHSYRNANNIKSSIDSGYIYPFLINPDEDIVWFLRFRNTTTLRIIKAVGNIKTVSPFYTASAPKDTIKYYDFTFSSAISTGQHCITYDPSTNNLYVVITPTTSGYLNSSGMFKIAEINMDTIETDSDYLNAYKEYTLLNSTGEKLYINTVFSFLKKKKFYCYSENEIWEFSLDESIAIRLGNKDSRMTYIYYVGQLGDNVIMCDHNVTISFNYTTSGGSSSGSYDRKVIFNTSNGQIIRTENCYSTSATNHYVGYYIDVVNNPLLKFYVSYYPSSGTSASYSYVIPTCYLATINNLDTPIYKTSSNTMKVIYTIELVDDPT